MVVLLDKGLFFFLSPQSERFASKFWTGRVICGDHFSWQRVLVIPRMILMIHVYIEGEGRTHNSFGNRPGRRARVAAAGSAGRTATTGRDTNNCLPMGDTNLLLVSTDYQVSAFCFGYCNLRCGPFSCAFFVCVSLSAFMVVIESPPRACVFFRSKLICYSTVKFTIIYGADVCSLLFNKFSRAFGAGWEGLPNRSACSYG